MTVFEIREKLANIETVDAEPVRHAEWMEPFPYANGGTCSQCETHSARIAKYCPECGAKMDLFPPELMGISPEQRAEALKNY